MMAVWKYPVKFEDRFSVELPKGAEVLHVDLQRGGVFMWARVNPTALLEIRSFRMAGTGHEIGGDVGRHVGSFMLAGDGLVFHVFEAS